MMRHNGGEAANWMVGGLAALAVAGAAFVCYAVFWGRSDAGGGAQERTDHPIRFKCDKCGAEFSLAPGEWHKQQREDHGPFSRDHIGKANCPKCQGRLTASMVEDPRRGQKPGVLPTADEAPERR